MFSSNVSFCLPEGGVGKEGWRGVGEGLARGLGRAWGGLGFAICFFNPINIP